MHPTVSRWTRHAVENMPGVSLVSTSGEDRVTLRMLYCASSIELTFAWDLQAGLHVAPEVYAEEGFEMLLIYEDVDLLGHAWEKDNPQCLLATLRQVRMALAGRCATAVTQHANEKIAFEASNALAGSPGTELLWDPRQGDVRMRIPLEPIWLLLVWKNGSGNPKVSIRTPKEHRAAMDGIKLPPWTSATTLIDFLPAARDSVIERLRSFAHRRAFFDGLVKQLGPAQETGANLEYISFTMRSGDFLYLAVMRLESGFPEALPRVELVSLIHKLRDGTPRKMSYTFGSPRWEPEMMAQKHAEEIRVRAPTFAAEFIKK